MQTIRTINAYMLIPILKLTGFRFSKDYRWGTTKRHALIYAVVDVVTANLKAGI